MKSEKGKKTIAVVTGTRAEFGLLRPVLSALEKTRYHTKLIVTGSHLVDSLGFTLSEIEQAGFSVAEKLDILDNDPAMQMTSAFPRAFSAFSNYFVVNHPDLLVVLGDRYEILAASLAASMNNIPVAHISGGDVTAGAKDDAFRHCITKLSQLHFPSTEVYRKRVVQLGENPDCVHNVGALGAENILSLPVISAKELTKEIGFDFSSPFLLVTYHPETRSKNPLLTGLWALLDAIKNVGIPALFTKANVDDGGNDINRELERYCAENAKHKLVESLGAVRYLSVMRIASAVVGNSSSAIVETPSLKIPAVNIGNRQAGRVMGENVICCNTEKVAIEKAIRKAVSDKFRNTIVDMNNPYGGVDVGKKIVKRISEFLETCDSGTEKQFFDIDFTLPAEPENGAEV